MWTAEAPLMAAPDSAIACIITAASVMPSPDPPNSLGIATPSQPPSRMASKKSCGKIPSRSRCSQYSSGKREHSFRMVSRMSC
jgi:hypothetical protein